MLWRVATKAGPIDDRVGEGRGVGSHNNGNTLHVHSLKSSIVRQTDTQTDEAGGGAVCRLLPHSLPPSLSLSLNTHFSRALSDWTDDSHTHTPR
mmetsp:Transcript_47483/g.118647  ORF Transcript_47483/g.118647 Transcript_47483/m.118647 type:complete len:94 (-) Transcript_47483:127-408(-)